VPLYRVPTHRKPRPHNSVAWQKASAAWLLQYPFCVLCLVQGRMNEGASALASSKQRNLVVDHIEPHRGDMELFWDSDNLETLCRMPCHDMVKQRHERAGKGANEWYEMLRQEMVVHGTGDDVARMAPAHVAARLGVQANVQLRSDVSTPTQGASSLPVLTS